MRSLIGLVVAAALSFPAAADERGDLVKSLISARSRVESGVTMAELPKIAADLRTNREMARYANQVTPQAEARVIAVEQLLVATRSGFDRAYDAGMCLDRNLDRYRFRDSYAPPPNEVERCRAGITAFLVSVGFAEPEATSALGNEPRLPRAVITSLALTKVGAAVDEAIREVTAPPTRSTRR